MSLQWRLALSFATLAALVAGIMGLLAYFATVSRLEAQVDSGLEQAVVEVVDEAVGLQGDRPDGPHRGPSPGSPYTAQLVSPSGEVIPTGATVVTLPVDDADKRIAGAEQPTRRTRVDDVDGTPFRILTQGLGSSRGAAQAGRDWSDSAAVLAALAGQLVVMSIVVAGLAAAGGWLLARRLSGRLVRLTSAAEHVARTGQLDLAVPDRDRDEVGRLASAFNGMLVRLAASKADQQRLVQDAGHELRTPLTSLRTNVSLLKRFDDLPPAARARVITDLEGETGELTQLVDEIVDMAVDVPSDAAMQPVELADVVRTAADRARRRSGVEVTVSADDSMVTGHAALLARAVWNLIENATKFGGSRPVEVTVRSGRVEVADRGPGIAAADLGRIFDRFYRSTTTRSLPGSGLGLAIVRDVAELHGGRVFAANREGGGAVVGFEVPPTAAR